MTLVLKTHQWPTPQVAILYDTYVLLPTFSSSSVRLLQHPSGPALPLSWLPLNPCHSCIGHKLLCSEYLFLFMPCSDVRPSSDLLQPVSNSLLQSLSLLSRQNLSSLPFCFYVFHQIFILAPTYLLYIITIFNVSPPLG